MMNRSLLLLTALLLLASHGASARTIWLAGDHHEGLTFDAMYCASTAEAAPSACPERPDDWAPTLDLSAAAIGIWDEKRSERAVRFPDDPVSELSWLNPVGLARWGWNMLVSHCGDKTNIIQGLRCSAHYGNFQFMHAMSPVAGIDADTTKAEILAWTRYLLEVIRDEDGFIAQNYCGYWASQATAGNPIAGVMTPEGPDAFPCVVQKGEPWSVGTMFAFDCKFNIYTCDVDLSPANVKSQALGALLHLIQDSYSQGHALRGDCCDGVLDAALAAYECDVIGQFNTYGPQNKKRHKKADGEPLPGASCVSPDVAHGPVVNAAYVLWTLQRAPLTDERIDALVSYFDTNVFALHAAASPSGPGAGF